MNNQGLEALAALASSVANAATTTTSPSTNSNDGSSQIGASNFCSAAISTGSVADMSTASSQVSDFTRVMQNAATLLQSTQNVTPQQWQQVLSAASGLVQTQPSYPTTANAAPVNTTGTQVDQSTMLALQQQLSLYQRLLQNPSQPSANYTVNSSIQPNISSIMDAAAAVQMSMRTQGQIPYTPVQDPNGATAPAPAAAKVHQQAQTVAKAPQKATGGNELASPPAFSQLTAIAPQPTRNEKLAREDRTHTVSGTGDRRQQKRAANRRSAQLSRKRKKAFIEELKDENDDLRRKEQILMSIPDLVVVFDSSGKLWFVSQSVARFLDFTSTELEGTSFWNRLCDDSVRLLKAAFMDSLAARSVDSDTAPLGTGFWELRLVDRDGSTKIVTLNGVVHFAGDRPECVCSIRPQEGSKASQKNDSSATAPGETSSTGSLYKSLIRVKPQQSVVSNVSSDSVTSSRRLHTRGPDAVRISDSGNSSGSSDGGSDIETSINA